MKLFVISPSSPPKKASFDAAIDHALSHGIHCLVNSSQEQGYPAFVSGSIAYRLKELSKAENAQADAIIAVRGGVGAIELWDEYKSHIYENGHLPLIGYSDTSILHFKRFFFGGRIGIHAPCLTNLFDNPAEVIEALKLLVKKNHQELTYPSLSLVSAKAAKQISGPLIIMNLASLQTLMGSFDPAMLNECILAIEDINEPHYKVHRAMHQLKNAGILQKISGLIVGHFSHDREAIIKESIVPLTKSYHYPVFDWPIFGHDKPNWPLLFGAVVNIRQVEDNKYDMHHQV